MIMYQEVEELPEEANNHEEMMSPGDDVYYGASPTMNQNNEDELLYTSE
jgi:hypothetical protein